MTNEQTQQLVDAHLDRVLNSPDKRHVFFRVLNFCNNFAFGFFAGFLMWVYPFMELARIISESIVNACGVK